MEGHEYVVKLLLDNGGDITCGNVSHFACTAVESNNLELLRQIVQYGGKVTQPKSNGTTALHTAVCEGNPEIVKFLLQQGADMDSQDVHGWTPVALADHQGHEEIKEIFHNSREGERPLVVPRPMNVSFLGRFQSEPAMPALSQGSLSQGSMPPPAQDRERSWLDRRRQRSNHFNNSLFGIMSAAANRGMNFHNPCSDI